MIHIQSITQGLHQSIINMEYNWKKPASFVVLIPFISLIFNKIKHEALYHILQGEYFIARGTNHILHTLIGDDHLLRTLRGDDQEIRERVSLFNKRMANLEKLHAWHMVGHAVQCVALLVLTNLHPLSLFAAAIACCASYSSYEVLTWLSKLKENIFYEFACTYVHIRSI